MYKAVKISLLCCLLMCVTSIGFAGINGTTAHSRANCVNNESITWWLFHSFNWKVVGVHYNIYGSQHGMDTGYGVTWRSAAVHWNEAPLGDHRWTVTGYHYLIDYAQGKFPFEVTQVGDCSIYDGWWDY